MSKWLFLIGLTVLSLGAAAQTPLQKRWVYASSNLYVDENLPKLEALLTRAQAAGYNGVLFTDYKSSFFWRLDDAARWERNAVRLRQYAQDHALEFVLCVFPFGYANSLLWHDVNLASGMPIRQAPLLAKDEFLQPEPTAQLFNGSFEDYKGDQALRYAFQDDPGAGSFIDHEIKYDGAVSLRFENTGAVNPHGHARICQQIKVKPWQQYRIRIWMKADDLTADEFRVMAMANGRVLQYEFAQTKRDNQVDFINRVNHLTCDWSETCVAFNSLDNDTVLIYAGLWGGKSGRLWLDHLQLETVPTLNLLRRESLPLTLCSEEGAVYREGRDFEPVSDPKLGQFPWNGSYESRHEPPRIKLTANTTIKPNQEVLFSGYHTAIVYGGQVNCSLSDPKVFTLCREQAERLEKLLHPDGFFMSHDEIRCAGWEPDQTAKFKTTGALLADNVKRCYAILESVAPGRAVYLWSDMFDPHHNATTDYYLVNNTLAGSWEGLDPRIVIAKWGDGENSRQGVQFFAGRGHRQIIAAYYDQDPKTDCERWRTITKDIPAIEGAIYTTWQNNYTHLEAFAQLWWPGQTQVKP